MAERNEILTHARELEPSVWAMEEKPEGNAVWSGRAYGARFELTRPAGRVFHGQDDVDSLLLTLRGKIYGQTILEQEFREALGEPKRINPSRRFTNPRMLQWDASTVLSLVQPERRASNDYAGLILDGLRAGARLFLRQY